MERAGRWRSSFAKQGEESPDVSQAPGLLQAREKVEGRGLAFPQEPLLCSRTAREVRLTVASPAPAPGPQPRGALGGGATETAPSRALPCPSPAWDQKLNGGFQSSRLPIHSKEEKFRKMVRVLPEAAFTLFAILNRNVSFTVP